jgi:hypothetical protein
VDWNLVLKIWAVLGPLIAAGISAVWARRIQVQDRAYEQSRYKQSRAESLEDRQLEFQRSTLHAHKAELRVAIAQFIAASDDFMLACIENKSSRHTAETQARESESIALMSANYQNVALLGTSNIAKAATQVLNFAADFPLIKAPDLESKWKTHAEKYSSAKGDLRKESHALFGLKAEG